ncbi:SpoIIE family protein phosphatase [Streptomyces violaceoruber]
MELASKAAVCIDNARLYGRERDHVVTLQRALLPRSSPSTPGLAVTSCYDPAADPAAVGGDWFDVVALPSGRTALMVGDVMGRGLAAAATMGRLRTVARTLMALDIAPERLLARLDLAARDLEEDQVATCLCAVYDPYGNTFRTASAGHPPPLLTGPDGAVSFLDVPAGAPLGTGVIPYDPVERPVPELSRLTLYTDGLIRSRTADLGTQLERLREVVGCGVPEDGTECRAVAERVGGDRSDDAIVLAALARPLGPECDVYVRALPPDGKAAGQARTAVREQLARMGAARSRAGLSTAQVSSELAALRPPVENLLVAALPDQAPAEHVRDCVTALNVLMGTLRVVVMQTALSEGQALIDRQRLQLLEVATPVIKLWDGIVAVPLIGTLDSARSQVVMETLLESIVEQQARYAILDITGVPTVDSLVAQHLMKTVAAARLMGAECIVSGIRPAIAQTMVHLGLDLGTVVTRASLADALGYVLHQLGVGIVTPHANGAVAR